MTAHLRYLRYVLLHKLAVFRAGWCMRRTVSAHPVVWVWRLLVHDLSKFSRAEWSPYVAKFYGTDPRDSDETVRRMESRVNAEFNAAWLHHIHHNPHHWQHHILHQDDGRVLVLIPDASYIDEMVADWLGAGPKAVLGMSMNERVVRTIVWYAQQQHAMTLREPVRQRVEQWLMTLAEAHGVTHAASTIMSAQRARESITIPGR